MSRRHFTRSCTRGKFNTFTEDKNSNAFDNLKQCSVEIVQLPSVEIEEQNNLKKGKKRKAPENSYNNGNSIFQTKKQNVRNRTSRRNLGNAKEKVCLSLDKLLDDDDDVISVNDADDDPDFNYEERSKRQEKNKKDNMQVVTIEIPSIKPSKPSKRGEKNVKKPESLFLENSETMANNTFRSKKKIKIFINESQLRQENIQPLNNLNALIEEAKQAQKLQEAKKAQELQEAEKAQKLQEAKKAQELQEAKKAEEEARSKQNPPEKVQFNPDNEKSSGENLDSSAKDIQTFSDDSSLLLIDDETAFLEFNDLNFDLEPSNDEESDKESKSKEGICEKNEENENVPEVACQKPESQSDVQDSNCIQKHDQSLKNFTLEEIVESFINSPQLECLREVEAIKRGLCYNWLRNNYVCCREQCIYTHNAHKLFTKKLKLYPSKFVMVLVGAMRNDILFVDIIMAAFEVITHRQVPLIWVTFLVFFVFYVTEPTDGRFLKFWANAARFYCQLSENYSAAGGFASLLSIFSSGQLLEEWKIIEFIKSIKQPPIQISINFTLLQPVLNLEIPPQLLTDAVKSCVENQENVLHIYFIVIPKIPLMKIPMHVVELLLKFCKTLETMDLKIYAENLKLRLKPKVQTFKIKIVEQDFPFTASFQNDIVTKKRGTEEHSVATSLESSELKDFGVLNYKKNYFEPDSDFFNEIIRALELTSDLNPSQFRNESTAPTIEDLKNNTMETIAGEEHINKLKQFFHNCQFDLLGKYLNELKGNILLRAAEEILKLLFQIKISLQEVLDLVKIMIFASKNENSAKVVACISLTLILNFVKINEWNKAYSLVALCHSKSINLLDGTVFVSNDLTSISQFRTALLLVEVNTFKENYKNALELIKTHNLHSPNFFQWNLSWKEHDEAVRIKIIEDYLEEIMSNQVTEAAHELFMMIRNEQKDIKWPIDLRKFANEVLTLLLNQNIEDALHFYEKLKFEFNFNKNTIRGVLITLVRHDRLIDAKNLFKSQSRSLYAFPEITSSSIIAHVSSLWLEEEIYILFDTLLDFLATKQYKNEKYALGYQHNFEITIMLRAEEVNVLSSTTPLCLGLINPSFDNTCMRIHRVFQNYFKPPVSFHIVSKTLRVDKISLQDHLKHRIINNFSSISDGEN